LLRTLAGTGRLLALRAQVDGQIAGMWFGAHYRKTFYALDVVTDRRLLSYSANNLMNWHGLRSCCLRGLEAFDFGGANMPSLAAFKASFGAELKTYSNIVRTHSPLGRAAVWLKEATVLRLRALRFGRSQKGRLQAAAQAHYAPASSPDRPAGCDGWPSSEEQEHE